MPKAVYGLLGAAFVWAEQEEGVKDTLAPPSCLSAH